MKDLTDFIKQQTDRIAKTVEAQKTQVSQEIAQECLAAFQAELDAAGNPYTIHMEQSADGFKFVPDDPSKAFQVEIGSFGKAGKSTTESDPNPIIKRAYRAIDSILKKYDSQFQIRFKSDFHLDNPTRH